MKLYTGRGDGGQTSLFDGTRVAKDDPRVTAYGEVDELNALLGWARAGGASSTIAPRIERIQRELFHLGAELATPAGAEAAPGSEPIGPEPCRRLEQWIDEATAAAPPLRQFILPGGAELAARLHVARTCCRRAERAMIALNQTASLRPEVIVYINRLSDLLFAWARLANHEAGTPDVAWDPAS